LSQKTKYTMVVCYHFCPGCERDWSHQVSSVSDIDQWRMYCPTCVARGNRNVIAPETKNEKHSQELATESPKRNRLAGQRIEDDNDLCEVLQDLDDLVTGREAQTDDAFVETIVSAAMRRVGGAEETHGALY
jgi:hypothetical protein